MTDPVALSWGQQNINGMSLSLTHDGDQLIITVTAPAELLNLEKFSPSTEGGTSDSANRRR